jgi:hypothetical protein
LDAQGARFIHSMNLFSALVKNKYAYISSRRGSALSAQLR